MVYCYLNYQCDRLKCSVHFRMKLALIPGFEGFRVMLRPSLAWNMTLRVHGYEDRVKPFKFTLESYEKITPKIYRSLRVG
jgi:hypothetical protein